MLPSSFWPCQWKNGSKWLESWWLELEERLLPNGFPSKKWDGRSCSVGRWVEMNLHNRPLSLPLLLYVPYVSIYRGGIVLWKIMTKLHSINKLGMVKKSTWSLKAWWKVLRLWITNMCIIDRQTDRFEIWVTVEGREGDGVFQAPGHQQLPLSTCSHYSQQAAPHWQPESTKHCRCLWKTDTSLPALCCSSYLWETGRYALI